MRRESRSRGVWPRGIIARYDGSRGIPGDERKTFDQGLRDQHPVERVAMQGWLEARMKGA